MKFQLANVFTAFTAFTAFAVLAMVPSSARADQKLVAAQSEVTFTSKQMGVPVEGRFRKFDAQVAFDPKKPEAAKIGFTVDLASATLGAAEFDAELAKPEWFNARLFPQATFQSTGVKALGGGKFDVSGKLVIKSLTRDVVVPVTLVQTAGQAAGNMTASGAFSIKRLDFRIGDGDWKDTSVVADAVQVKFKLALTGVAPL